MDIVPLLGQLALVFFLVFMNGFFVAAEFCVVKVRESRLDVLIQEGNKRAAYAKKIKDHLDAALSVTQLGITLASLGLGWVGEPFVAELIMPAASLLGIDDATTHRLALAIAFFVITSLHIVLGELTPKSLAIQNSEKVMLAVSLPLLIFHRAMYPFVWLLNTVANFIARQLGFNGPAKDAAHTEEEIRLLVEESHRQGLIDDTEVDFVDNVFDFTEKSVREIMVPRTDMVCLYLEDSLEENLNLAIEQHLTRYPICHEDKDHIIGFLHIKDLLRNMHKGKKTSLTMLARKALFVPESMDVSVLLKMMQRNRSQLAIVVDEFGGTSGMVTIEDLIEEIVGDIQDEFDEERPQVERRGALVYSVDAKMQLADMADVLEVSITDDDVDTIGGWLYDQIGMTPRVGQMVAYGGNTFTVEEVDEHRIKRVLVCLAKELAEEHEEIA